MKINNIKSTIYKIIKDRYEFEENNDFQNELLSLADEELKNMKIIRIKRLGINVNNWKTLVLIEIQAVAEIEIKFELKKAIQWLAVIKESLLGTENTDLYLFLAFSSDVSNEECLRIESTEQFCRKYVLMPDEDVEEFVNRTFLQKLINSSSSLDGKDPLERAFFNTNAIHSWLTPEIQKKWKKAFLDHSGSDLADVLLEGEDLV